MLIRCVVKYFQFSPLTPTEAASEASYQIVFDPRACLSHLPHGSQILLTAPKLVCCHGSLAHSSSSCRWPVVTKKFTKFSEKSNWSLVYINVARMYQGWNNGLKFKHAEICLCHASHWPLPTAQQSWVTLTSRFIRKGTIPSISAQSLLHHRRRDPCFR